MSANGTRAARPAGILGEGKWGGIACLLLTPPLLVLVTLPLGRVLLVLCAYGYEGYEQGIRVVGTAGSKRLAYSTGERLSAGAEGCFALGSFLVAGVAAVGAVALVRWCFGCLGKRSHRSDVTAHCDSPTGAK